jgi:hypothetical protein
MIQYEQSRDRCAWRKYRIDKDLHGDKRNLIRRVVQDRLKFDPSGSSTRAAKIQRDEFKDVWGRKDSHFQFARGVKRTGLGYRARTLIPIPARETHPICSRRGDIELDHADAHTRLYRPADLGALGLPEGRDSGVFFSIEVTEETTV